MQNALDLEPPCPGYDACPVALCGCRWLGTGLPWSESDERTERSETGGDGMDGLPARNLGESQDNQ